MRFRNVLVLVAVCASPLFAQDQTYTNSVGMQFVLIKPGSLQVGVFTPTCPDPNGRGGGAFGVAGGGNGAPGQPTGPGITPATGVPAGTGPGQGSLGGQPSGGPGGLGEGARGRGAARGPVDPRTRWTEANFAKCQELIKQDAMAGFKVNIDKPYYIGKYEVTQEEWKKVMGTNPSYFQGDKVADDADKHPVDSVTWDDTQRFLKKLNAMEKTEVYRLPTEFEWEYAGRAGGPGQVLWADIRLQAWEQLGPRGNTASTQIVGTKQPNAWGVYDMLGNVWEWVQDFYNYKIFPDPVPPKKGTQHVLKGGGFLADVKNVIYATHGAGPGDRWDVGFRIVRDVK